MAKYQCSIDHKPFRTKAGYDYHLSWAHPQRIVSELADDAEYAELRLTLAGLREMARQGDSEARARIPTIQSELYRLEAGMREMLADPIPCVQCGQQSEGGICEQHQGRVAVARSHQPDAADRQYAESRREHMRSILPQRAVTA